MCCQLLNQGTYLGYSMLQAAQKLAYTFGFKIPRFFIRYSSMYQRDRWSCTHLLLIKWPVKPFESSVSIPIARNRFLIKKTNLVLLNGSYSTKFSPTIVSFKSGHRNPFHYHEWQARSREQWEVPYKWNISELRCLLRHIYHTPAQVYSSL